MKGCLKRSSSAPHVNQLCASERLGQSQSLPRQRSVSQQSPDLQHNIVQFTFQEYSRKNRMEEVEHQHELEPREPGQSNQPGEVTVRGT